MRYFAFISYSNKDKRWAKRLHHVLDNYRLPAKLRNRYGLELNPLRPLYFALADIQPGFLENELDNHLRESKNLIVIGSPNSAKSHWVGKEIEFFHSLGRDNNILYFIIDGVPNSAKESLECFHPIVQKLGMPEILGVNINEKVYSIPFLNKERAIIQLITKLLGLEFDEVWNRHLRQSINRLIAWFLGILLVVSTVISAINLSSPFDLKLVINEQIINNDNLSPPNDLSVLLRFEDGTEYAQTLPLDNSIMVFRHIPHQYLGKRGHLSIKCRGFLPIDSWETINRDMEITINRDPDTYGRIRFSLWDPQKEEFIGNVQVAIADTIVFSDNNGMVSLDIPLQRQRMSYPISVPMYSIEDSIVRAAHVDGYVINISRPN